MFNAISFVNEAKVTAATVTMGFAPGNQTPAQLLLLNPAGAQTVNLPPISSATVAPPTTSQTTVGVAGGFRCTLFNLTSQTITVAANGSDVIVGTVSINTQNSKITFHASALDATWYVVA